VCGRIDILDVVMYIFREGTITVGVMIDVYVSGIFYLMVIWWLVVYIEITKVVSVFGITYHVVLVICL